MKKETITIRVKCKIEYEEPTGRDRALDALVGLCAGSGFGVGSDGLYEYRIIEAKELIRGKKTRQTLANP